MDSGVAEALASFDNEVVYGRRGTGKTHAFAYLAATREEVGDIGIYVDLRTLGSAQGIFDSVSVDPVERTSRLLVDLLERIHDAIMNAAIDDPDLVTDEHFVSKLDRLMEAISAVRIEGPSENTIEESKSSSRNATGGFTLSPAALLGKAGFGLEGSKNRTTKAVQKQSGTERRRIDFGEIALALRELADALSARQVWLLLDEWSSVPLDIQPYLGAFLVRCISPLPQFVIKIAAIERQTRFRLAEDGKQPIGIELGADFAASLDLDEFMVFEQDSESARDFFRTLFFKHLTTRADDGDTEEDIIEGLRSEKDFVRLGFTDARAFDELVRAAEGVPRDAINIAAKAAFRAKDAKISMPDIRTAARQWYQADKEGALKAVPGGLELLNWIIDKVIRDKKARGFLVNQRSSGAGLITALFDARVLHLVREGYSAQDSPGERYDAYSIDYGAYVQLINTKNYPEDPGVPAPDDTGIPGLLVEDQSGEVEVPEQDLRAIRRAILNLDEFFKTNPQFSPMVDFEKYLEQIVTMWNNTSTAPSSYFLKQETGLFRWKPPERRE